MKKVTVIVLFLLISWMSFGADLMDYNYNKMVKGDNSLVGERYSFNGKVADWNNGNDGSKYYFIYTKYNGSVYNDNLILLIIPPNSPKNYQMPAEIGDIVVLKQAVYKYNYEYTPTYGRSATIPVFLADGKTIGFLQ